MQWFSIPEDLVEHPQSLRNAGYQSKVKVLEVATHVKPVDTVGVDRLRWKARLAGAAASARFAASGLVATRRMSNR